MTRDNSRPGWLQLTTLAAAVGGLMLASSVATAQPYDDDYAPATVGELTVTAPEVVGRSAIGAPIERVSASRVVEFRDLDLETRWGRDTLRSRIRWAARSACDELDARYPTTVEDPSDCYRDAVRTGMVRASYVTGYEVAEY